MKLSAFKVCHEFTSRIDGAPVLNGIMRSHSSLPKSELFFNNEEYLKASTIGTPAKKGINPGYNYCSMLHNFIYTHFEVGKKYLVFLPYFKYL